MRIDFERAVEQAGTGAAVCDRELRIQWANQIFYEMTGFDTTVIGAPFVRMTTVAEHEQTLGLFSRLLVAEGPRSQSFDREVTHPDGRVVWLTLTATAIHRRSRIVGVLVVCHDITDHKADLIALELRTRQIIETAGDAFVSIDPDETILDWNREAERLFGWFKDEIIGRRLTDTIVPVDQRDAHDHGIHTFLSTGQVRVLNKRREVMAVRKDGREVPVELTPWMVEAEGRRTFSAFLRDNSDRHEAEAQQAAFISELERVNDELRRADKLKNEFVSTASHELRTPVTAIGLANDYMRDNWTDLDDERRQHFLAIIDRQSNRLTNLVNDLLIVSRIDAGITVPSPEPTQVLAAVQDALTASTVTPEAVPLLGAVIEAAVDAALHPIEVDVPSYLWAYVDPSHLQQMLTNYLVNARKYGSEPFRVVATQVGGTVSIEVVDAGDGVAPAFVPSLFTKFARWEGISNDVEGSGLGLSITKGLAEANGGTVWYRPDDRGGSRFGLGLPAPT